MEFISCYDRARSRKEALGAERVGCTRMFRMCDEFNVAFDIRQSVVRDDVYSAGKRLDASLQAREALLLPRVSSSQIAGACPGVF